MSDLDTATLRDRWQYVLYHQSAHDIRALCDALDAANGRIAATLALHVPARHITTVCNECRGGALLPCPTVRALTEGES